MKTVIFVPTYWYSSLELFTLISKKLGDSYIKVLLETGDPHYNKIKDKKKLLNETKKYFDHTLFLDFPDSIKKSVNAIPQFLRYQRKFKHVFDTFKPKMVITTGDRNHFYQLLKHYKGKDVPILLFQESLLSTKYYLESIGHESENTASKPDKTRIDVSIAKNKLLAVKWIIEFARKCMKRAYYDLFGIKPFLDIDYSKGWGLFDPQNKLFLWGPITEKLFSPFRKNIYCSGYPLIDDLYNSSNHMQKDIDLCERIELNPLKKTILISAPCLYDIKNKVELFSWYESIFKVFNDMNIVLKMHPRDKRQHFKDLSNYSRLYMIKNEFSFKKLLRIADLSLSHYSATSADAIAAGVPTILLPITALRMQDRDYWFSSPIFIKPKTIDSCINSIWKALNDFNEKEYQKLRREFMNEMFSCNVGQSTDKIIDEINRLI